MPEVLMPRLSDATTEATIVAWLVPDGTVVRIGDEVVEIETDKATTAWPADADGVLSIEVPAGHTVCPGTAIARIGAGGTTAPGRPAVDGAPSTGGETPTTATAPATNGNAPIGTAPSAGGAGTAPAADGATPVRPTALAKNGATGPAPTTDGGARTTTTPTSSGTGPNSITPTSNGTGPISTTPAARGTSPAPATTGATPAADDADPLAPTLRTPSRIETLVSARMVQSRTEIPEFTASVEIDMGPAVRMRGDLKAVGAPGGGGRTPSVNDLFVKACALALVDHPRIRSAWTDDGVLQHERIDVGVAVATDDGGLVVPVVRGADRTGLAALAASTRELTGRARKGAITPAEMSGATFSISNLGAMGISHFTAIIGPGQGAILAVGATIDRFVPVDGQPVLRPICTVTLSSDHRVIYGAHAAAFLERLRTILEHPGALAF